MDDPQVLNCSLVKILKMKKLIKNIETCSSPIQEFFYVAGLLLGRVLLPGHVLRDHRCDVEQGRSRRYSQRLLVLQDPHHGRARRHHLRYPHLTSRSGTRTHF